MEKQESRVLTIPVSFRLERALVKRLRRVAQRKGWPPGPNQTEIVARGIEIVLDDMEKEAG